MDYGYGNNYGGMSVVTWLFSMAIAVFLIVCYWKVFEKAGKPG